MSDDRAQAEIRVARLTPACAAIAAQAVADIKLHGETPAVEDDARRLRTWLENATHILLVALDADRPIGFALGYLLDRVDGVDCVNDVAGAGGMNAVGVPSKMLFFYEIEVLPTYRRRGVGGALVERMKHIARTERVAKMWVQTDPENHAARGLYERMGGQASAAADLIYTWTASRLQEATEDASV